MTAAIRGAPAPQPGPSELVVQLGAGQTFLGVILSTAIWGVGTHWNDRAGKHGRSERCEKEHGECSGCNGHLPCRWKGYLHVYCFVRKRDVFLELTPGATEQLNLQVQTGEVLRGLRIHAMRGGGGKKSRIDVKLDAYNGNLSTLPAEKDPEPILQTLWKWGR